MNDSEKRRCIAHAERQFQIHQSYALYWQTMAMTGAAKLRAVSRGCEKTPEFPDGWRELTDQEKTQEALDTMKRHIHLMAECNDAISELMAPSSGT